MLIEKWKSLDFLGFPKHQVSNSGKVRCLKWNPFREVSTYINRDGYVELAIGHKHFRMHQLVGLAFIDNPENKPEVNHKDGNKENNWDWNLEWNTKLENIQHAINTGLRNKPLTAPKGFAGHSSPGSKNSQSKLTDEQVRQIRNIYKEQRITFGKLGKLFNVSDSAISNIISGKSYKSVQ